MSPEDFPQFDDPRVRQVFAAAANLVVYCANMAPPSHCWDELDDLKTTLFAAQHSKPKVNECANCGSYRPAVGNGDLCQECLDDVAAGEAREAAQHSKPRVWPCPTKPGETCTAAKCDWGCKT